MKGKLEKVFTAKTPFSIVKRLIEGLDGGGYEMKGGAVCPLPFFHNRQESSRQSQSQTTSL